MTPETFHWTYQIVGQIPGGAQGQADGFSTNPELALSDVQRHIKKLFPAAPAARFKLAVQRPDQALFEVHGGGEYNGMLAVTPISKQEMLEASLEVEEKRGLNKPVVYHNPRARQNWAFLIPVAERLAVAIITGLGAATWRKVSSMSIPERAAWLEKNSNRLLAMQTVGLSIGANKLMNMIPAVPEKRKAVWLQIATLMGDPGVQEAAQEAGKAVATAAAAPRAKNNFLGFGRSKEPALPALTFQEAAARGTAMEKQARSRFGLVGRGTTHFVVKAPSSSDRGPVWYFLDGVNVPEMDRASSWGVPKQYIDEKDPWLTVVSNIEAYGNPDAQSVVMLDTYADTISGPFNREDVWKLAKMGRTPPPVARRNPGDDFETAWHKAYMSRKALKAPDGRVLEPIVVDDDDGKRMEIAYYENGRLASISSLSGAWQVVPRPARKNRAR